MDDGDPAGVHCAGDPARAAEPARRPRRGDGRRPGRPLGRLGRASARSSASGSSRRRRCRRRLPTSWPRSPAPQDMDERLDRARLAATGRPIRLHALCAANADRRRAAAALPARRAPSPRPQRLSHRADARARLLGARDRLPRLRREHRRAAVGSRRRRGRARPPGAGSASAIPSSPRYIFGHSLGGAIAVQLAARLADEPESDAPQGVIVEGTFTSIRDMFGTFKWGWLPISMLITERFDSLATVPRIKAPLLVVHGSDDSLVPSRFGRAALRARDRGQALRARRGRHALRRPAGAARSSTARRCASSSASADGAGARPQGRRGSKCFCRPCQQR